MPGGIQRSPLEICLYGWTHIEAGPLLGIGSWPHYSWANREVVPVSLCRVKGFFLVPIYEFEGRVPKLGENVYVHPSADIIGLVTLGDDCYVAPGARIRGDYGEIVIGRGTSIEENCVIHSRPDQITRIGDYVTVGHGSIIHTAIIHDYVVIGMGSIISDWAVVGEWAAIAEGAVVTQSTDIPPGKVAVGVPAKVTGDVKKEWKELWGSYKHVYPDLARRYPTGLKEVKKG
jgi:phenylacetic acid degradation protein